MLAALKEAGYGDELLKEEDARLMIDGKVKGHEIIERKLHEDDSVTVRLKVLVEKRG